MSCQQQIGLTIVLVIFFYSFVILLDKLIRLKKDNKTLTEKVEEYVQKYNNRSKRK